MESVVLVEVLNEDEEVITSHRFSALPISCGRGYNCDLRFDDLYICPEHFTIEHDKNGELKVVDQKSVNGLISVKDRIRVESLEVKTKALIKVGATTLRVINTKISQAPTIPASRLFLPVVRPHIRLGHCVSAFSAFLAAYYINTFVLGMRYGENQNLETLVKGVISGLTIFIPWAAAWSMLGRIIIKKFRYFSHFLIATGLCTVYMIFARFTSYVEFGFGSPLLGTLTGIVVSFICIFLTISLHLFYSTRLKKGKRWLTSGAFALVIVSMFALVEFKDSLSFSPRVPISTVIKPPWARLVGGISSDALAKKVENLHSDLEIED